MVATVQLGCGSGNGRIARERSIGIKVLAKLAESDLAGRDEWLLLDAFQERALEGLEIEPDTGEEDPGEA